MDKILIRFPLVGENIFKQLDNKCLSQCKKVDKIWHGFLENGTLIYRRRIQKYSQNLIAFRKDWKLVSKKASVGTQQKVTIALEEFFNFRI